VTPNGVRVVPGGTLVDRVLGHLAERSSDSLTIARDVLGIGKATPAIAERVAEALLGADPRVRRLTDGRWSLAGSGASVTRLASCSFAVVDVETTGARSGKGDRITEIAVYSLRDGVIEPVFASLVNPERPIPRFVSTLTSITNEMVREEPTFADIAGRVTDALSGHIFAAHNARFDWAFVARELKRARSLVLSGPRVCTVQLSRRLVRGLKSRGLDSVAEYFGIEIEGRHRAAGDALATAKVLSCLLDLAVEQGIETIDELTAASRARRRRPTALPSPMGEA
jgi:DNA polymerase-3 subunit epsilon